MKQKMMKKKKMKPKRSTEEWRSGACGLAFVVALREKVEDVICMARQRPGFSFYAKKKWVSCDRFD